MPLGSPSKFYGRRRGRISPGRQALLQSVLAPREVPRPTASLDPRTLFSFAPREIWLEIGFGGGEHLVAQALAHEDVGFLGIEAFISGVGSLLGHLQKNPLPNIRIFPDDAHLLLPFLTPGSLDRIFLLFPDPWPKIRHQDRRFLQTSTLETFVHLLKPKGQVWLATDHPTYQDWVKNHLLRPLPFTTLHKSPHPPEGWHPTRYEAKALAASRFPYYWILERI